MANAEYAGAGLTQTVTRLHRFRFNDSTLKRFSPAKPFVIFSPICLKFVRHEINRHSHARSNAIQDYRGGEHVFAEI